MENTIEFIIWGVRNGFEVIHASKNSDLDYFKELVTDDMRQVCNIASNRFYSVYRNKQFAAITIYNPDTKDFVGRKAYVAITLYIPHYFRFDGNLIHTLQNLANFYTIKQGNATVKMFTEDMIRDQYKNITAFKNSESTSVGIKKGYVLFNEETDIAEHLEKLSINGYKALFFFQKNNIGVEKELIGYEEAKQLSTSCRITLENYNPQKFTVLQDNQPIEANSGSLAIDGFPNEFIIVTEIQSGRQRRLYFENQYTAYDTKSLFPAQSHSQSRHTNSPGNPSQPKRTKIVLLICTAAIVTLGILSYLKLNSDQTEDEVSKNDPATESKPNPQNSPTPEQVEKEKVIAITFSNEEFFTGTAINKDNFPEYEKKIKKKITGIDTIIKSENSVTITLKPGSSIEKNDIKTKIKNLFPVSEEISSKPPTKREKKEVRTY